MATAPLPCGASDERAEQLGELLATMVLGVPMPVYEALQSLAVPPPSLSPADRADAVRSSSRLLDRVGDEAITLTQAGYLPPAHVQEVVVELEVEDFRKNNREVNAIPMLEFHDSAQDLGMLRKARGRLLLTKSGPRARRDPHVLWRLITDALPRGGSSRGPARQCAQHAGVLLLVAVAAGLDRQQRVRVMTAGPAAAGWHTGSGDPLPDRVVSRIVSPTSTVLKQTAVVAGAYSWPQTDPPLSATAIALARAALVGELASGERQEQLLQLGSVDLGVVLRHAARSPPATRLNPARSSALLTAASWMTTSSQSRPSSDMRITPASWPCAAQSDEPGLGGFLRELHCIAASIPPGVSGTVGRRYP